MSYSPVLRLHIASGTLGMRAAGTWNRTHSHKAFPSDDWLRLATNLGASHGGQKWVCRRVRDR